VKCKNETSYSRSVGRSGRFDALEMHQYIPDTYNFKKDLFLEEHEAPCNPVMESLAVIGKPDHEES